MPCLSISSKFPSHASRSRVSCLLSLIFHFSFWVQNLPTAALTLPLPSTREERSGSAGEENSRVSDQLNKEKCCYHWTAITFTAKDRVGLTIFTDKKLSKHLQKMCPTAWTKKQKHLSSWFCCCGSNTGPSWLTEQPACARCRLLHTSH